MCVCVVYSLTSLVKHLAPYQPPLHKQQSSVWGSGLAGILCAAAALASGDPTLWRIGFVASFVSKLSDTVSSEIGKVGCMCRLWGGERCMCKIGGKAIACWQ